MKVVTQFLMVASLFCASINAFAEDNFEKAFNDAEGTMAGLEWQQILKKLQIGKTWSCLFDERVGETGRSHDSGGSFGLMLLDSMFGQVKWSINERGELYWTSVPHAIRIGDEVVEPTSETVSFQAILDSHTNSLSSKVMPGSDGSTPFVLLMRLNSNDQMVAKFVYTNEQSVSQTGAYLKCELK